MKKKIPDWWFEESSKLKTFQKDRDAYFKSTAAGQAAAKVKFRKIDLKHHHIEMIRLVKEYPDDIFITISNAAILGDYGQCLGEKLEKKYKKEAANSIRKVFGRLRGQSQLLRNYAKNEYYYHTSQYLKQYTHGIDVMRTGYLRHFPAGVGASMHALELAKKKKFKQAKDFGTRAKRHWETHNDPVEIGGIFYCQSLAFAGQEKAARNAFAKMLKNDKFSKTVHKRYYSTRKKDLELAIIAGA